MKGWLVITTSHYKFDKRYYPIANVSKVADLGVKVGDVLHLRGLCSFRVKSIFKDTDVFTISVE